jgi:hypothetical protein
VKRCKQCGDELTAREFQRLRGSSKDRKRVRDEVELVFTPMPCLGCSCGAERRVAYGDFLPDLRPMINELVPHAEAPRFGKTLRCGSCDEAVTRESATARTFDVDLAFERTIPFHLKLTAPGLTCPKCGKEQLALDDQLDSDLSEALIAAIDSERIKG